MKVQQKDRALFLDRDGTIVHPRHYPARPDDLLPYDGIAPGLRLLQEAGFRLVIITNQAGIARGYFSESDLQHMHEDLARRLADLGVQIDLICYCPHHPEGVIPEFAIRCECRKPQPGMLLRAAERLNLDLGRSWFVGDILDDVEAGKRAGCRTVLVDLGTEQPPQQPVRTPNYVARNTVHALRIIGSLERLCPPTELNYCPRSWRK